MVENLDNARKNKKIKEIKKYINDKMETKNLNPFTTSRKVYHMRK